MAGLARDGGLYVPESWPALSPRFIRSVRAMPYAEAAFHVIQPFVGDCMDESDLRGLIEDAYRGWVHHSVAPLFQIGPDEWLLELYHGPTLAFKDVAMQVLGRLYDHFLEKRGGRITVVGATSGDTGSAAIEAIAGRERADDLHHAPAQPHVGGPAPADDHGRCGQRSQHRHRRHVR